MNPGFCSYGWSGETDIDRNTPLQCFFGWFRTRFQRGNSSAKRIINHGAFRAFDVKNHVLVGVKARVAVLDAFSYVDAS